MRRVLHTCPVTGIVATSDEHAERLGLKTGKALRNRWSRHGKGNPESWAPSLGRGHNRDIPFAVNGKTYPSRVAASRATGIPDTTLKRRARDGVSASRLGDPTHCNAVILPHPVTGVRRTCREWASRLHIDASTFRRHLRERGRRDPAVFDSPTGRPLPDHVRAELDARREVNAQRERARVDQAAATLRGFAEELGLTR